MTRALAIRGVVALVAVVVGGGATACKSDKHNESGGEPAAAQPAITVDAAAVNALVPAALKDRLVFENRDLVIERGKRKTTYTVAAPKGWPQSSKMFAQLRPDDKAGRFTRFEVGSNCDGECTPKAWQAIADRVNFAPRGKGKVSKDDHAPGRRTMIAEVSTGGAHTTDVIVAWWTDGARSYHTCSASLDDALKEAAPAFDKACQSVVINGDD